jgi:hypothetical protein
MSQPPQFSAELLALCGRLRDQELTEPEAHRLSELLVEKPEARRFYLHFMAVTAALETRVPMQGAEQHDKASDESVDLLLELLQMEQQAEGVIVHAAEPEARPSQSEELVLLLKDAGVVKELAGMAIRSRPAKWLAAAAAVLLGLSLLIVIYTRGNSSANPTEAPSLVQTPEGSEANDTHGPAVATLTAQAEAQWQTPLGESLPGIGDGLYSGQHLTLTKGFAEITTNRGAIARIQGPATFELIDHDNAIRLHAGKLVGICESDSSKGFLVRTPHMDITDLGTRFGVDATQPAATEVHVIEGEIKVVLPSTREAPIEQVLTINQAVVAHHGHRALAAVEPDTQRFASIDRAQTPDAVRQVVGGLRIGAASAFVGKNADQWPASEDAFLFEEFVGPLASGIEVDMVLPGDYKQIPSIQDTAIPAGTVLRSYVLVKTPKPEKQANLVSGSVTFDEEIVGIIVQNTTADAFARAIAPSQMFVPGKADHDWIDLYSQEDVLVLSQDRRTIEFAFETNDAPDTIRVLVRAKQLDQP